MGMSSLGHPRAPLINHRPLSNSLASQQSSQHPNHIAFPSQQQQQSHNQHQVFKSQQLQQQQQQQPISMSFVNGGPSANASSAGPNYLQQYGAHQQAPPHFTANIQMQHAPMNPQQLHLVQQQMAGMYQARPTAYINPQHMHGFVPGMAANQHIVVQQAAMAAGMQHQIRPLNPHHVHQHHPNAGAQQAHAAHAFQPTHVQHDPTGQHNGMQPHIYGQYPPHQQPNIHHPSIQHVYQQNGPLANVPASLAQESINNHHPAHSYNPTSAQQVSNRSMPATVSSAQAIYTSGSSNSDASITTPSVTGGGSGGLGAGQNGEVYPASSSLAAVPSQSSTPASTGSTGSQKPRSKIVIKSIDNKEIDIKTMVTNPSEGSTQKTQKSASIAISDGTTTRSSKPVEIKSKPSDNPSSADEGNENGATVDNKSPLATINGYVSDDKQPSEIIIKDEPVVSNDSAKGFKDVDVSKVQAFVPGTKKESPRSEDKTEVKVAPAADTAVKVEKDSKPEGQKVSVSNEVAPSPTVKTISEKAGCETHQVKVYQFDMDKSKEVILETEKEKIVVKSSPSSTPSVEAEKVVVESPVEMPAKTSNECLMTVPEASNEVAKKAKEASSPETSPNLGSKGQQGSKVDKKDQESEQEKEKEPFRKTSGGSNVSSGGSTEKKFSTGRAGKDKTDTPQNKPTPVEEKIDNSATTTSKSKSASKAKNSKKKKKEREF